MYAGKFEGLHEMSQGLKLNPIGKNIPLPQKMKPGQEICKGRQSRPMATAFLGNNISQI